MRGAAPRAAHFLLRGQEKVSKEVAPAHPCARDISTSLYVKAARGLAATRYPALLSISGVRELARQKTASLKHPSLDPEMPAMLGVVQREEPAPMQSIEGTCPWIPAE